MIRRPPRSTPFPTRRSSDLDGDIRCPGEAADARPLVVKHDLVAGVDLRCGEVRHRVRILPPGVVPAARGVAVVRGRSEEHTSELQSRSDIVCRLLLDNKNEI